MIRVIKLIISYDYGNQEVRRRGLKTAVVGIPKTIDNDIPVYPYNYLSQYKNSSFHPLCLTFLLFCDKVIDKSFGFDTAVEEAQRAINAAHVEAESVENGIGLVKLMGRDSGKLLLSIS